MKSLLFKEDFEFFQKEYGLSREIIYEVYTYPTRTENYSLTKKLCYKKFNDRHLILCVKRRGGLDIFSFCFWIPDDLFNLGDTLNGNFKSFTEIFGSIVQINGIESKYIDKSDILPLSETEIIEVQKGKLDSLNRLIVINAEKHTPHFSSYNILLSNRGVELSNIFAINNFKYIAWIRNVEFETISVDSEWEEYLDNIVCNINPIERTKLEIKTISKSYLSYKKVDEVRNKIYLSYPKLYNKQFEIISMSINEGGNVQVLFPIKEDEKKCVFCGDKTVSKEHIFPKWFRKYFPEQKFDNVSGPFTYNDPVGSITKGVTSGTESSYGITSRNVCGKCNYGWMSDLEKEIKSILTKDSISLIENINDLDLTNSKSFALSKWLICKAILLAIRSNSSIFIPNNVLVLLKDNIISKGFVVEILQTKSFGLNYMTKGYVKRIKSSLEIEEKRQNSIFGNTVSCFVSVFHIGKFLFRISFWEHEEQLKRVSVSPSTTILFPNGYGIHVPREIEPFYIDRFEGNNLILLFAESLLFSEL